MGGRSRLCGFILVFVLYQYRVSGQVSSICRPNERFLSCGSCQPTCKDPVPVCAAVCKTGCYCNEGEVRNETGHCVKLSECPPIPSTYLHTTEPRPNTYCPEHEEYRFCEPCNKTCDNPNPICPAQCARGCFCVEGLLRDNNGKCVTLENCSNSKKNESSNNLKPKYELTCGLHQIYKRCQKCERTCSYPHPVCYGSCSAGCFCEEGYLKSPSGQCVKLEECPSAEISMGGAQEPTVEDCRTDEIYLQCGWCEPSCSEPRPECPAGVCTRGCLCKPPLLRHHSGHCVEEKDCMPQRCIDHNEEYVCRYGCEAKCVRQQCFVRPRRCVLGCHCKLGLLRDITGRCVTPVQCVATSPDTDTTPWKQEVNITKQSLQDFLKFRDPYRKVNGSVFKTYSDGNKPFIEVQTYVEGAPSIIDLVNRKNIIDTFLFTKTDNKVINEGTTPKTFKDVISMAHKFYNEFENSPIYREIPIDIKGNSVRSFPVELTIPLDTRDKMFKEDIESANNENDQVREVENGDDNIKTYETTQREKSNKENEGTAMYPVRDLSLSSYVKEILSAMKDMVPEQMNFTIVNSPTW